MKNAPTVELIEILLPAFHPCIGFTNECSKAVWNPLQGNIPRGFAGATAGLKNVEIIVITAEPGDPHSNEHYTRENGQSLGPKELLEKATEYGYMCLESGKDQFHRNVRQFLDHLYPMMPFPEQMTRVWFTDAYLCSAKNEGGTVPKEAEQKCVRSYLDSELTKLLGRPIVVFGRKAQFRIKMCCQYHIFCKEIIEAWSLAPPGCNRREAKISWLRAAEQAKEIINNRRQIHD